MSKAKLTINGWGNHLTVIEYKLYFNKQEEFIYEDLHGEDELSSHRG